jgi:hypothetical protein
MSTGYIYKSGRKKTLHRQLEGDKPTKGTDKKKKVERNFASLLLRRLANMPVYCNGRTSYCVDGGMSVVV